MKSEKIHVGLVAGTPGGSESLALAYLAASLKNAGHTPHVRTFNGGVHIQEVAQNLCKLNPPLIGVSLPSGHASIDAVALVHLFRALGYKGHITVGGAFTTLSHQRILERVGAIDSVIRYDGEVPGPYRTGGHCGGGEEAAVGSVEAIGRVTRKLALSTHDSRDRRRYLTNGIWSTCGDTNWQIVLPQTDPTRHVFAGRAGAHPTLACDADNRSRQLNPNGRE